MTLLRGTARGGREDGNWSPTVRATLSGMGWAPRRRPVAATCATGGSRCRRWSTGRWSSPAESPASLGDFVDDLDRRAAEQHAPVADGVTLATLHAAKGLEWDAVFLVGLQDGTLPIIYADTAAAVEEERRLLYVGMTRARRELSSPGPWRATPVAGRPASPRGSSRAGPRWRGRRPERATRRTRKGRRTAASAARR